MKKMVVSRQLHESLRTIISDPDHKNFTWAVEFIRDEAIGAPVARSVGFAAMDGPTGLGAGPTALPPVLQRQELVREVFNEAGELVKRYGQSKTKLISTGETVEQQTVEEQGPGYRG